MYYEINVSMNGRHLFATAERSLTSEREARQVAVMIRARFPEPEFKVTVRRYETVGITQDF